MQEVLVSTRNSSGYRGVSLSSDKRGWTAMIGVCHAEHRDDAEVAGQIASSLAQSAGCRVAGVRVTSAGKHVRGSNRIKVALWLGKFTTPEEAHEAYMTARRALGK